jgi:transmembrane sensor
MPEELSKYQAYTPADYLEKENFRHWVLRADLEAEAYWEAVFTQYPQQRAVAEEAKRWLQGMQTEMQPAGLRDRPLDEAFIATLRTNVAASGQLRPLWQRRQVLRWLAAASIALLLGVGLWWGWLQSSYQTVTTAYAEWRTVQLPDGSEVRLNANSQLRYASGWKAGEAREVWLAGEAFFEVEKDPQGASFTVHAGDLGVEVLGTAFNVNRSREKTEVFLQEGKVKLDLGVEEKMMSPGDLAVYSIPQKRLTSFRKSPAETHISWKDGSLILRDKPVAEIFVRLEAIYGFSFVVKDSSLLAQPKTVALPMGEWEVARPILERVLGVSLTQTQNKILVK